MGDVRTGLRFKSQDGEWWVVDEQGEVVGNVKITMRPEPSTVENTQIVWKAAYALTKAIEELTFDYDENVNVFDLFK